MKTCSRRQKDLRRNRGDGWCYCWSYGSNHGRRRWICHLPDVRLCIRHFFNDNCRNRHPSDHLHCRSWRNNTVCDLRLCVSTLLQWECFSAPLSVFRLERLQQKSLKAFTSEAFMQYQFLQVLLTGQQPFPKKLVELEVINWSKPLVKGIETAGNIIFWVVVAALCSMGYQQVCCKYQCIKRRG